MPNRTAPVSTSRPAAPPRSRFSDVGAARRPDRHGVPGLAVPRSHAPRGAPGLHQPAGVPDRVRRRQDGGGAPAARHHGRVAHAAAPGASPDDVRRVRAARQGGVPLPADPRRGRATPGQELSGARRLEPRGRAEHDEEQGAQGHELRLV